MSDCGCSSTAVDTKAQRRVLSIALALNGTMFVVEVIAGWLAHSTALAADGLDMLADASAYGVALMAVGRSVGFKANAAMASGLLLFLLGIGVLAEVVRRLLSGETPYGAWMIGVAAVALLVNVTVLRLLGRQRREVHIEATWIFTRMDVIANAATILSGIAVLLTGMRYFDLVVGAAVGVYVVREALEILARARAAKAASSGGNGQRL